MDALNRFKQLRGHTPINFGGAYGHETCTKPQMECPRSSRVSNLVGLRCALVSTAVAVCAILSLGVAYGVDVRPHSAALTTSGLVGLLTGGSIKIPESGSPFEKIPTLSIRGRVHALGRFDVALTTKRNLLRNYSLQEGAAFSAAQKIPILLQGTVALGGGVKRTGNSRVVPAAVSVIDGELELRFSVRKGTRKKREYSYLIRLPITEKKAPRARVKRIFQAAFPRGTCQSPVEDVEGKRGTVFNSEEVGEGSHQFGINAPNRIVTLSTDADQEWHARYGTQSLAHIASIINAAEALYFRQIGIGFAIHKQHIYTDNSPYTASGAGALLDQFLRNPANQKNLAVSPELYASVVDAKHLFTGKDLDGSTVGIAYLRTICQYPALTFGLSQDTFDVAAPAVFAHEMAHNLGAFHDYSSPDSIMYPTLTSGAPIQFSELSRSQIDEYLGHASSCLNLDEPEISPTPTPATPVGQPGPDEPDSGDSGEDRETTLSLEIKTRVLLSSRRFLLVRGRLSDQAGSGVARRSIELHRNQRLASTKFTNSRGRVSFVIPRRSTREIFLTTPNGRVVSQTIDMSRESR